MKFIIVLLIAWLVGVFGWSQIIGSLQNLSIRKSLIITLVLWIVIMSVGAYFAILKFNSIWAMIFGYLLSLIQVIRSGKIE